jgi:hypothetical protein
MNPNLTEVVVVLDESSSMYVVKKETIEGYNALLTEQVKQPGDVRFSLYKFSTQAREPMFVSQANPPLLHDGLYNPMGMTALYDAVGKAIDGLGRRLSLMPEKDRPSKVVFVIQTDGEENASREYSGELIKNMIQHQKSKYNWDFMFIGSATDIDVDKVAQGMGIAADATIAYNKGAVGTANVFASASNYISQTRSCGVAAFSTADRDKALIPDAQTTVSSDSVTTTTDSQ